MSTSKCEVCNEPFSEERAALGYKRCLKHGEKRKTYPVAPAYNKGGLQLITPSMVKFIGRK